MFSNENTDDKSELINTAGNKFKATENPGNNSVMVYIITSKNSRNE